MIRDGIKKILNKRVWRHTLFWLCWVLGFTFIKSFGKDHNAYLDWLAYYLLTLPIFISHTYLVCYFLIPRFLAPRVWPVFILLFVVFFFGFSCLELVFSYEYIYRIFDFDLDFKGPYFSAASIIRNGVGNFYIVLIFLAAKSILEWSQAENERKSMLRISVEQEIEETMTRIQPWMLLYAIDNIDSMVSRRDPGATKAIAHTSELLSEVMIYFEDGLRLISREIELVQKLLGLVELFRKDTPEVEFFISGDPGTIELPPMILFSFFDVVIRKYDEYERTPEINVEVSGFSNILSIQILHSSGKGHEMELEECIHAIKRLEESYKGEVSISYEHNPYGCFVIIKKEPEPNANAVEGEIKGIGTPKTAGA